MPGKKNRIPEIDKEFEKLKDLGVLKGDYLGSIYSDFFEEQDSAHRNTDVDFSGTGSSDKRTALFTPSDTDKPADQTAPSRANSAAGAGSEGSSSGAGQSDSPESVEHADSSSGAKQTNSPENAEPEEDPMKQLDSLIGLQTIKHDVKELVAFEKIQKMRKDAGLKTVPVSLHLVFTGNPGTGKTTVARILAKLYRNIGVLSKGQLVEVDRSGLVAGYVGQTALKTQDAITKALGGVLFIDEAYALSRKDDSFGQEAIDTILKAMEDHRDDFVVIVAGYTKPMEKFIDSNPGLKSRFNKYIDFPDYTVDELMSIFLQNCEKYDYILEEDAKKHVREQIVLAKTEKKENFANAREVRNLFEKIITNQAARVAELEHPTHDDMVTITIEDLTDKPDEPDTDRKTEAGA